MKIQLLEVSKANQLIDTVLAYIKTQIGVELSRDGAKVMVRGGKRIVVVDFDVGDVMGNTTLHQLERLASGKLITAVHPNGKNSIALYTS